MPRLSPPSPSPYLGTSLWPWLRLGMVCGAMLAGGSVHALYKVVSPDGKVSYTDRPPADANSGQNKVVPINGAAGAGPAAGGTPLSSLPIELRQVATRYPVVLYSAPTACTACDMGRSMLKQRGIPFTERHVSNAEDGEALQKLTGSRELPVMVVGSQVNRGFTPDTWKQYIDAAGYPPASALPANYEYAPATPLTERKQPPAKTAPGTPAARPAPAPPPAPTPGGIQF